MEESHHHRYKCVKGICSMVEIIILSVITTALLFGLLEIIANRILEASISIQQYVTLSPFVFGLVTIGEVSRKLKTIFSIIFGFAYNILNDIRKFFFVALFRILYLTGPSFGGYGWWEGKSEPDICSALTNVDSQHWIENPEKCSKKIDNNVQGWVILVEIIFYSILAYNYFVNLLKRITKTKNRIATPGNLANSANPINPIANAVKGVKQK